MVCLNLAYKQFILIKAILLSLWAEFYNMFTLGGGDVSFKCGLGYFFW